MIGPFSMEIDGGEIPLVFPTNLINPKSGLTEIQIQEPYKVLEFIIVPDVIPSFMTYNEPADVLMFDTRTTPRDNYKVTIHFAGPYTSEPVIRELKLELKDNLLEIEKSENSTSSNTTELDKNETISEDSSKERVENDEDT